MSFCSKTRTGGSQYCKNHKCCAINCKSPCQKIGEYCEDCRCYWENCPQGRRLPGWFCRKHTCNVSNCVGKVQEENDYCNDHRCQGGAECSGISDPKIQRCSTHRCEEAGCAAKHTDTSLYCAGHKCYEADCAYPRKEGDWYCATHSNSELDLYDGGNLFIEGTQCQGYQPEEIAAVSQQKVLSPNQTNLNREIRAYGLGYNDGFIHGSNLPPGRGSEIDWQRAGPWPSLTYPTTR